MAKQNIFKNKNAAQNISGKFFVSRGFYKNFLFNELLMIMTRYKVPVLVTKQIVVSCHILIKNYRKYVDYVFIAPYCPLSN
jgi:hypothetical protein